MAAGGGSDKSAPYLTLRRLALWLAEPMQQLRQLCVMADAAVGLQVSCIRSRCCRR